MNHGDGIMSNKTTDTTSNETQGESDDLRTAVGELNQNVAYLSKMVLQLQRSLSAKKKAGQTPDANSQPTLH